MIYLQNNTESQVMFVPKNGTATGGALVFEAKSTIDLDVAISQEVTDMLTSDLYYVFGINLPDGIPDGEYQYTLTDDGTIASTGLLVVGENFDQSQYLKEISYEQYKAE